MNIHVDKTQRPQRQSVAATRHATDDHQASTLQKKLQRMANTSPRAFHLKTFQEIANNASYAKQVVQLQPVIQKAPWTNVTAKFRTDNGMPDIPMSEYYVKNTTYLRYAPINEVRAPGQIFHEGPRSFAYIDAGDADDIAYKDTMTATPDPNNAELINLGAEQNTVVAHRTPLNGRMVWDGDVQDNGVVDERHPGHTVTALGLALPHLDNDDSQKLARYKQEAIHEDQLAGLIDDDESVKDEVYAWIDKYFNHIPSGDARDNAGLKYLADHPEVAQNIQDAKDKGQQKFDTEKASEATVKRLWTECNVLENIDKTNPVRATAFYTDVAKLKYVDKDAIRLLERSHVSRFWVPLKEDLKSKVITALNQQDTEKLAAIRQLFA